MASRRSTYVQSGPHELHVSEWGDKANPALIMWHGLARTGRDFDEAAQALSDQYFVLCPDTLGRGLSSWAKDASTDYSYAAYGEHALSILDHYGIDNLRWIGTSMGGLLGVTLAAGPLKQRITHLVINDIGPRVPEEATGRIADYVSKLPVFDGVSELERWLRTNYAPFGNNTDAFWRRMTDTSSRRRDDGRITVHYDPQIASQFTIHRADLNCWPQWDAIEAPTLLLRGESSDVLPKQIAEEMTKRGPKPKLVEFADCGHAPTLTTPDEQSFLRSFLGQVMNP